MQHDQSVGSHYVVRSFKNGTYTGRIKDGKLHGRGRFSFYTGELYDGDWQDSKMHGDGEYTYGDGSHFKGEFQYGLKHGVGTYFPVSEEPYVAQFLEGNLIAQGSAVTFDSKDQPNVVDATTDDLVAPGDEDSDGNTPFEKALDGFSLEKAMTPRAEVDVHNVGVGIVFQQHGESGVCVKKIVHGGPASKSKKKLKPKDVLTHVQGQDVREFDIDQVAGLVKGEEGSGVEMHFVRSVHGHSRPVRVILQRGQVDTFLAADQKKKEQNPYTAWSSEASLSMQDDAEVLHLAAHMQGLEHDEAEPESQDPHLSNGEGVVLEEEEEEQDEEDDEQWFKRVASAHSITSEAICIADLNQGASLVNFPTPATLVYLNLHRANLAPMFQHPMLGPQLTAQLIAELADVMKVPLQALRIADVVVAERSRYQQKMILGQVASCPGDDAAWHDPTNLVVCSRVLLHIKQPTAASGLAPSRVVAWQNTQAEHLQRDFAEQPATFAKYKYLRTLFDLELRGCVDGATDLDIEHLDEEFHHFMQIGSSDGWQPTQRHKERLGKVQMEAQEETRGIWSQRFLSKYGNPTLLVLNQQQHVELLRKQPVAITETEVHNTSKFHVIKRLNMFEDGPRLLTLDRANKCIINEADEDRISALLQGATAEEEEGEGEGGKRRPKAAVERKRIPFHRFTSVVPHEGRPTHLTIKFRQQRDYDVDFASERDRALFQLCLKPWVAESCWGLSALEQHGKTQHAKTQGLASDTARPSLMRSIALYHNQTGKIPTSYDRGGHPEPACQDPFKGNTAHPVARPGPDNTAFHVLIPANAKTPTISYQQAAYVTKRKELAVGYYGDAAESRMKERTPTNQTQRSLLASVKLPKPEDPRRPSQAAEEEQQAAFERTAARVHKGEFSAADHVLAYKLLYGIAPDRQLTRVEVQQAVEGEYGELMVKVKAEQIMAADEERAEVRARIFDTLVKSKHLVTSGELLDRVEREQRGLEECRRFQEMLIQIHQGTTSEALAHPVAFVLRKKKKKQRQGMGQWGSMSSRSSRSSRGGSQHAEEEEEVVYESESEEEEEGLEQVPEQPRPSPVKVMQIQTSEWMGAAYSATCMGGVARAVDLQVSRKATSVFESETFQVSLLHKGDAQLQVAAKGPPWTMRYYGGSAAVIHEVPGGFVDKRAYQIQRPDGEDLLMFVDRDSADPDVPTQVLPQERCVRFVSLDQTKEFVTVLPTADGWEMSFYAPLQPAQIALGALVVTMGRFEERGLMHMLQMW